jgi:hypothetical protein
MDRNGNAKVDNGIVDPPGSQDIVFEIDVVKSTKNNEIVFEAVDSDDAVVESAGSEDVVVVKPTGSEGESVEQCQTSRFLRHLYL